MKPLILIAALLLASCATRTPTAPLAAEYRGDGFVVAAPKAEGWRVGSAKPEAVVFHKRFSTGNGNDAALVSVGVLAVREAAPAPDALVASVQRLLQQRLSDAQYELIELKVAADTLGEAQCARYDAVQVDRYDADSTELRREYTHQGYFCRHPTLPRWFQTYATTVYPRIQGPPLTSASRTEIAAFFGGVHWSAR
ncbi:hypothetical protein [Chitinolyticbacter albus]|uniref:hypothetical protein n=1 Tax=Chitinolyticbacter albus TaxID=2961951 RepID=UPI00210B77BA|nr:hypothetical protein [Chitinolyticbacter albus]